MAGAGLIRTYRSHKSYFGGKRRVKENQKRRPRWDSSDAVDGAFDERELFSAQRSSTLSPSARFLRTFS